MGIVCLFEANLTLSEVTFGVPDYTVFTQDNIISANDDLGKKAGSAEQITCCTCKENLDLKASIAKKIICPSCQNICNK